MLRISEFILNFVLNSLWQSVVVFAVAAIASLFLKNRPARYRHTLWVVALGACLVAPLLPTTRWVSRFQAVALQVPLPVIAELKNASPVTSQDEKEDVTVDHLGPRR